METNLKFVVVNKSISSHCCFDATVMDTTKPVTYNVKGKEIQFIDSEGVAHFKPVCECFTMDDAILICKALNDLER